MLPNDPSLVYKVCEATAWRDAEANGGVYRGSAIDKQDGFIHMSSGPQLEETLRLHFGGQRGLMLVGFDTRALGNELKWEASRGGALFPHLYDELRTVMAVTVSALDVDDAGVAHVGASEPGRG